MRLNYYELGDYLRKRRIFLNYSLDTVAVKTGISRATLARIETSEVDKIDLGLFLLLCRTLYLDYVQVIEDCKENENEY